MAPRETHAPMGRCPGTWPLRWSRKFPGGNARAVHNAALASIPPSEVCLGNMGKLGRNRKSVSQVLYRQKQKEAEADGWKDDLARLERLRQELIRSDRDDLPPESDPKKRAKRVLGYVQSISYYPRGFVLFPEPQLILYRMACRLPEGLRADFTAGVLRKVKVLLPCGDEVLKHQFLFILSAPNMFSGEFLDLRFVKRDCFSICRWPFCLHCVTCLVYW